MHFAHDLWTLRYESYELKKVAEDGWIFRIGICINS